MSTASGTYSTAPHASADHVASISSSLPASRCSGALKRGTRVSTALFGLSATRDLGIGQVPRWISENADSVSPMSYPVLYGGGELGLVSPAAQPGETVFRTLTDFRRQVKGSRAQLVPWVQDWNYTPQQVLAQIAAARLQGAKGYLLWNASGLYTTAALAPAGVKIEG